ncbi:MAG: CRP/FNR family cyclic AMP-dependent transcriptional regulator [Thermoproteota archaeon]|jgi:CRP/FNR family cyclic AMP-dependent transcriptional regulator
MSIMNIVKSAPLFYELFDKEIESIVEKCQILSLEEGEFVFREGDAGEEIYIILTGFAHVKKGEIVLAELRKGDLFGEMILINQNERSADIVASTYTDVLVLGYDAIFGFYESAPKIFSLLILNLSRLLTQRLERTGGDIKKLADRINELEEENALLKSNELKRIA